MPTYKPLTPSYMENKFAPIDLLRKLKQDFTLRGLVFQLREDRMSDFEVMANKVSTNQVI